VIEHVNVPGLSDPPVYSHADVATGVRLVLTAGAIPLNSDGNLAGHGEYVAQARQVLDILGLALAAAGVWGKDVPKTTVYVVSEDGADLAEVGGSSRALRLPRRRARSWASRFSAKRDSWSRWRRSR
jgi:enamine deaminase RidA (YjgF/YER057c/UK114 family)